MNSDAERPCTRGISSRELRVLQLVAAGRTDAQIAEELCVSLLAVHDDLNSIYAKFEVTERASAVAHALQGRLIR